jgi:hypothetical protein
MDAQTSRSMARFESHARGTVRVGRVTFAIAEFSTGCRTRADAEAVAAAEEARIRTPTLDGPVGGQKRLTIADALLRYLNRPGGVAGYDQDRIADFSERIGHRTIVDAVQA